MKTIAMVLPVLLSTSVASVALAGAVPEISTGRSTISSSNQPGNPSAIQSVQPVIPPIDRRPDGAIENRPLWDRPDPGPTLQQQAEHAMDRGNGRLEDPTLYQLRQDQLDKAAAQYGTPAERAAYAHQQDRADQVEQLRLKSSSNAMREQRTERESDTLAVERRNWEAALHRDNNAAGATVDKQALDQAEATYRSTLDEATKNRDLAFAAAGENREQRAAAQRAFEQTKADAMNSREARRASVLGNK